MRSRALRLALVSGSIAVAGCLSAQPYAWIPGSSQDPIESGNRLVIVNLATNTIIGQDDRGFEFYPGRNVGADPLIPGFSPDGRVLYLLVGGDKDDDLNGYLRLFRTADVISALESGDQTPEPFQTFTYTPAVVDEANEPVAVTVSPDGSRVVVVVGDQKKAYVYMPGVGGSLTELGSVATGDQPGPLWFTADGAKGYIADFEDATVTVVNLAGATPSVSSTVSVPPPAKSNALSITAVTGSFAMPEGTSVTGIPYPGVATTETGAFRVFSGHFGFKAWVSIGFGGFFQTITDNHNIYSIDTATDTATLLETVTPTSTEVIIPPLTQGFTDSTLGTFRHNGGSRMYRPEGGFDRMLPANADMLLLLGQMASTRDSVFIGTAAVPNALGALANPPVYDPKVGFSIVYRYDLPARGAGTGANVTLTQVGSTISRNTSLPLGFAGSNLVVAGNDVFSADLGAEFGTSALPRNTQIILLDTETGTASELTLGLVGGSGAIQPTATSEPYDPTDSDGDGYTDQIERELGTDFNDPASRPDLGDYTEDGLVDVTDALTLIRRDAALGPLPFQNLKDVDRDGDVDSVDGTLLFEWVVGQREVLPPPPAAP